MFKKLLIVLGVIGIITFAPIVYAAYVNVGPTTDFKGDVGAVGVYKESGAQIDSDDLSDTDSIGMLDENEAIAGNWVNTVNPWADNEVISDLTIDSTKDVNTTGVYKTTGTQIASDDLSDRATIGMIDEAETIGADWVNTANPWADDEVNDDITVNNTSSVATTGSVTVGATGIVTLSDGDLTLNPDGTGEIVLSAAKLTSPATLTRHYRIGSCAMGGTSYESS